MTLQPPSFAATIDIELAEWERVGPAQDRRLKGLSLQDNAEARSVAERLRSRIDIREGYDGLEIASTQFVGHVDIGPMRISIRPKLPAMPLARLLRFAYGLRDLTTFEETVAPTVRYGLQDLLVSLLASEVQELLRHGLSRRYTQASEKLTSPRGRILMSQIVRQGGVLEAKLPCEYFERQANWHLNRVIRAGLELAARIAGDRDLRGQVQQLSQMFFDVEPIGEIGHGALDKAMRELTRLTETALPALTLIRLLQESMGIAFSTADKASPIPGFLFDMNIFFQRLLSRFLHLYLSGQRIADERSVSNLFSYAHGANPRKRTAPRLRPDFALLRDKANYMFLDAKYRDVWIRGFDLSWLYQLSSYALASPCQVSIMLYSTMEAEACDEQIEISPGQGSQTIRSSIILRPVLLSNLAILVGSNASVCNAKRYSFAKQLVSMQASRA